MTYPAKKLGFLGFFTLQEGFHLPICRFRFPMSFG